MAETTTEKSRVEKKDKKDKKDKKKAGKSSEATKDASDGFQLFKGKQSQLDDIFGKGVSWFRLVGEWIYAYS